MVGRPGSMFAPAVSMARHHLGGLVAVFCAVLGGSAMITAGLIVGETGLTSHVPAERLAPAPVVVSALQSHPVVEDIDIPLPERVQVPAGLAEEIAQIPGVERAVSDLTFDADLIGFGPIRGHNWQVAALGSPDLDGRTPQGAHEVVLDSETARATGLGTGDEVEIAVRGEASTFLVTGVADAPGAGFHVDRATATELLDRPGGGADLVAVTIEPGADLDDVADAIEAAYDGRFEVTTGDARGDVETIASGTARGELIALSGSLAGTLLILVGCIVAGALSVSVANQRRDLALLRAVGATPCQVRRLVATQACCVAGVALLPGVVLGYVLAGALASALTDAGMVPAGLPLARSPFAALIVTALMLGTVQLAARGAARRASRMPATEAVAESRVEPREPSRIRTVIGLVLIAVAPVPALVPLFVRSEEALISSASATLLGIVGLALAGPVLVRTVTRRAAGRLGDRTPVPLWLAVKNSHAYALRTAGSATVLVLAIGLTLTQFYVQTTSDRATTAELEAGLVVDATLTGGFSSADVEALGSSTGVDTAVPMTTTSVVHAYRFAGERTPTVYPAFALGRGAEQVVDPEVTSGDLSDLTGETIALSSVTARTWRVDVGESVDLVLANGADARARVVAVYERGFGFGGVMVSTDLLASFGGDRWFDTVLATGDPAALDTWADGRPGTRVEAGSALVGDGESSPESWINIMVLLVMLGYVLLAVANSLVASTLRRREEFAALWVIGATRRQVLAMVTRETTVLVILAIGAGLAVSLVPMSLLGLGIAGRPWPQGGWWLVPAVSAVVALIAFAATRTAAARALRLG